MCILFVFTDPTPSANGYRFIAATNREEDYLRPTHALHAPQEDLLGGEDLKAGVEGGMWLGVSTKQCNDVRVRLAALLNVLGEESESGVISRGGLVRNYLEGSETMEEYVGKLQGKYNAYNLVGVELSEQETKVIYNSNAPDSFFTSAGRQILAFGNSPFDTPFQKVIKGREEFQKIVSEAATHDRERLIEKLITFLKWEDKHLPDAELQRRSPNEYAHYTSVFVKMPHRPYGTRTHSIVLVDYNWTVEFIEATLEGADATQWKTRRMRRAKY